MGTEAGEAQAASGARVVGISLLVVVLTSSALALLWTASLMTNDDTNMAAFASGDYTGRPTAHLVFVSAPFGVVLAGLHTIAQGVPWYSLMLISISLCSIAVLVALAYLRRSQLRGRGEIAVLVLVTVALPTLLLRPSFTTAAIVLCTTGIILLAAAVRSQSHAARLLLFGAVCLGLGAMVRFDSFKGVVGVFLPFIATVAILLGWRRSLTALVVVTALVGSSFLADRALSSSPDWSSYTEFNEVRGQLSESTDFERAISHPTDPAVAKVMKNIGWTEDDAVLFISWLFYDPQVYSTGHLSELVSLVSGPKFNSPIRDSVLVILRTQRPLWILSLALGLAAAVNRRRESLLLLLVQIIWCAAVFSVTAASQRFPPRVSIPLYLALGIVLSLGIPLIWNDRFLAFRWPRSRGPVGLAALVVASVLVVFHAVSTGFTPWEISRDNEATIDAYHNQLQVLNDVDPAGRFLCLGSVLTIEGTNALSTTSGYRDNKVLCTGWPTPGPSFARRKAELGSSPLMLDTLATDDHFYLVLYPFQVPVVERLYERYLGMNVTIDRLGHLANGGIVGHVRP